METFSRRTLTNCGAVHAQGYTLTENHRRQKSVYSKTLPNRRQISNSKEFRGSSSIEIDIKPAIMDSEID